MGIRQAGLALLHARCPRGPDALRSGMGGHRPRRDAPHWPVPARGGRRRGAVDRRPARAGPHSSGGDAGPPGPHPPPRRQRPVPGPRRLPGRRAAVRAAVHCPRRSHRGPPPHPRRNRQSRPARARRGPPPHPALPRQHGRRRGRQPGGVLCPPGPDRGAGPPAVQRQEPRPGHRVCGQPAWRHRQERGTGLVRRRQARGGSVLAQAAPAVDRPGPPARPRTAD